MHDYFQIKIIILFYHVMDIYLMLLNHNNIILTSACFFLSTVYNVAVKYNRNDFDLLYITAITDINSHHTYIKINT